MNSQDTEPLDQAEATANVARATFMFDAIDEAAPRLTEWQRQDYALRTWRLCMEEGPAIPDNDVAALTIRAAKHLHEEMLVDLVDAQFGEHEKRIRLDGDQGAVTWLPDDEVLILSYPSRMLGGTVDAVLARPRTRIA